MGSLTSSSSSPAPPTSTPLRLLIAAVLLLQQSVAFCPQLTTPRRIPKSKSFVPSTGRTVLLTLDTASRTAKATAVVPLWSLPEGPSLDSTEDDHDDDDDYPSDNDVVDDGTAAEMDNDDDDKMKRKIDGRKKRLIYGYELSSILCLLVSAYVVIGGTTRALLTTATAAGPLSLSFVNKLMNAMKFVFAGGSYTLSSILWILQGAASNDRLSSDTYKRLNIAGVAYGLVSLLISCLCIPSAMLSSLPVLVWNVSLLLMTVNCIKGYGYGVWDWEKKKKKPGNSSSLMSELVDDFCNGLRSIIPTIFRQNQKVRDTQDGVYATAVVWFGGWAIIKNVGFLVSWIQSVTNPSSSLSGVYNGMSNIARFGILSTIVYTLSDASSRQRLNGSTFIKLGFDTSIAFLTLGLSSIVDPSHGRLGVLNAVPFISYSIFLAYNAVQSARTNATKKT